ncbi:MAG: hypothetical protein ACRDKJ_14150 [Actinomycetota bacterium]
MSPSGSLYRRVRWRARRRRRPLIALGVLALGAIIAYVLWPGPDVRAGSEEIVEGRIRVASRIPSEYRLVYRVESRAGDELVVSTEKVWVRRAFEARVESWTGAPPGRRRTSTTVHAFARINTGRAVFAVPPAPAPQDFRIDANLAEAERAGYADAREHRRVGGRICRVYRRGAEGGSGTLSRLGEKEPDEYTDTCFDAAGLPLEVAMFVDGKLLTRSIAVVVDEDPQLADRSFRVGAPTLEVRQGGGSVLRVDPDSRPPGDFWEARDDPRGFDHFGRYAVIPPQAGFEDPTQRPGIVTFVSDVWTRGRDVIVVEQGATLGGRAPFQADPNARKVAAGDLGRGELAYGLRTSEVRILLEGGHFVRVHGTLAPSRLLAVARSLSKVEGGDLVYLDEIPS